MRTRIAVGVLLASALATLALGAMPAGAKAIKAPKISANFLKQLSGDLSKGKKITFDAVYKSVSNGGTTETITIAQAPPKSDFSTGNGQVVDTGSNTYYCSGSTGHETCLSAGTDNPFASIEALFSPAAALSAFSEAKEGLLEKSLGIKVSSSSVTIGGQASTCVSVTEHGSTGKYCVTKQGVLTYSGANNSYFELTKYSSSPPASLFQLPAGATTETLPGGVSIP
jgi:hypothetical protein